jgi:hypothetical protein
MQFLRHPPAIGRFLHSGRLYVIDRETVVNGMGTDLFVGSGLRSLQL